MIRVCSKYVEEVCNRVLLGRPEGKSHLEDLGGDGRVILDSIFKKWDQGHRMD